MTQSNEYINIGEFRSKREISNRFSPSRLRKMVDDNEIDGVVVNGVYMINKAALPTGGPCSSPLEAWAKNRYREIKKSAIKRGIDFNLTLSDLTRIVARCDGMCELTGIRLSLAKNSDHFRRPFAPSVDRIDSSLGYSLDNCRIVCIAINSALNEFGLDVLLFLASALLAKHGGPTKNFCHGQHLVSIDPRTRANAG